MLGQPVPMVAPALGVLREVEAVAKRLPGVASKRDGREIQDGEGRHISLYDVSGLRDVPITRWWQNIPT